MSDVSLAMQSLCHSHVVHRNCLALRVDCKLVGLLEALDEERLGGLLQCLHGLLLVHNFGSNVGGNLSDDLVKRSLLEEQTGGVLQLLDAAERDGAALETILFLFLDLG